MNDRNGFYFKWGLLLVVLSAATYGIHFFIFRDAHHLGIFLVSDIAFVFLEVLLVTLIIHRLIEAEEKTMRSEKLFMVIGAFFREIGNTLLHICVEGDPKVDELQKKLLFNVDVSEKELIELAKEFSEFHQTVNIKNINLQDLRRFLMDSRTMQLRLVENPVILEHEHFSDLLRAVYHLTEELLARADLRNLPDSDLDHLKTDIERAYEQLIKEWFTYIIHLHQEYPYLFSFIARMNPFKHNASPVIENR